MGKFELLTPFERARIKTDREVVRLFNLLTRINPHASYHRRVRVICDQMGKGRTSVENALKRNGLTNATQCE